MPGHAVRHCNQCRRANPGEATYCYYDGVRLDLQADALGDGRAIDVGKRPFAAPFVLPSGRECGNFNELARACHDDPKAALDRRRDPRRQCAAALRRTAPAESVAALLGMALSLPSRLRATLPHGWHRPRAGS